MENTCNYKECKLFDLLGGSPEQCPNYMESWWRPSNDNKPILVRDCAPRRTLLMIQDLSNRLVGVQKSQEEQRDESTWVQVVAEVLGKNSGVNLNAFVKERQRLQNVEKLKLEQGDDSVRAQDENEVT